MPLLLITVAWAVAVEPVPACSDAAPCGPDWGGMVQVGLVVGLLYWLARLPELTLIAAPALAAMVAWVELPGADRTSQAANVAVIGALAFGWAQALERLAGRSRQRRLAERAADVRHRLPKPVGPLTRGRLSLAAGLVLCAVAAGAVLLGLRGIRADEQHTDRAVRTTATVLSRGAESVRVRTDDERRITVDALYPEDHRVGSTVTVLEDGPWRRLGAEPYDAFAWQLLLLAAGLPGLSFLTAGVLVRRRALALRRAPVPALRALRRVDRGGRTWVHAADDTAARTALFTFLSAETLPGGDEPADHAEVENEDEEEFPVVSRLHEAVLLGAPHEGGELVMATTDRAGVPIAIRTAAPVRLPRSGKNSLPGVTALTDTVASGPRRPPRAQRLAAGQARNSIPCITGRNSKVDQKRNFRIQQIAVYSTALLISLLFLRNSWLFITPLLAAGLFNFIFLPRIFHRRSQIGGDQEDD
ncbi:hypothetical protein [Streptomyces sp. Amel2xC10]|uniref:hypothetical protein n=1 Tax=Streptomyces sp. Amel2xC10 TaxID=1305826 RepID=UPI0015C41AAB|nr:hypothetical protein [Streptomyces sp. Amel2xC10]